ncbi:MAG: hypothetical protein KGL75_12390 [Acidobacteriota bacterium]|nr:hypothetical protein [Acidobacteriota bacterium]
MGRDSNTPKFPRSSTLRVGIRAMQFGRRGLEPIDHKGLVLETPKPHWRERFQAPNAEFEAKA